MKIGVLVKQVPDTASKIEVKADHSGIDDSNLKFVLSPYDEFAVEEAIKTKEKTSGEATVITVGSQRSVEALRTALAMGVDKAVHVDSEGKFYDNFSTAHILAEVIKKNGFDIVFCGKQATDDDGSQVVQMTAEFLDWPHLLVVEKIELDAAARQATATRRVSGGGKEIYETSLPVIIGCEKGLNTPRYASLPGIMKAKSKPVEKLKAADLLGGIGQLTELRNFQPPEERKAGTKIEGEAASQAHELVRLLREEAKVI